MLRNLWILALLGAVLATPILMRPAGEARGSADDTLVIITPHNEATRYEFTRAFRDHYKAATGRSIMLDWRTPGGTSEISRYLASEYVGGFENYWRHRLRRKWTAAIQEAFANPKVTLDDTPGDDTPEESARRAFLASDVSCGIDLFFGGGAFDFSLQADAGRLVDCGLLSRHPEWFGPDGVPFEAGGERYWDREGRWIGTCLSSFGICYNTDSLRRLHLADPPDQWEDLADPRYFGEVALADPTQSGSVAKAFEMLIQQQMLLCLRQRTSAGVAPKEAEAQAVRGGWKCGLQIIQRAAANARYFTDAANKIPWDVELGDAAAGMCIDFYGRFQSETVRKADGRSRLQYLTPDGGSSVGADPIGLLRGAPHLEAANAFMDFVLSIEGQKLWGFKLGSPGGPEKYALRRLAIRPEIYAEAFRTFRSDPTVDPYHQSSTFEYHSEWTNPLFRTVSFVIRAMCIDTHDELREAWAALIDAKFPPEAERVFSDVSAVGYDRAEARIRPVLRSADRIEQVRLAKTLSDEFRAQYDLAKKLAESQR